MFNSQNIDPSAVQSGVLSGDPSAVQSGVLSGDPSAVQSGVLSGVQSAVQSGVLSGDPSAVQSGVLSGDPSGYQSGYLSDDQHADPSGDPYTGDIYKFFNAEYLKKLFTDDQYKEDLSNYTTNMQSDEYKLYYYIKWTCDFVKDEGIYMNLYRIYDNMQVAHISFHSPSPHKHGNAFSASHIKLEYNNPSVSRKQEIIMDIEFTKDAQKKINIKYASPMYNDSKVKVRQEEYNYNISTFNSLKKLAEHAFWHINNEIYILDLRYYIRELEKENKDLEQQLNQKGEKKRKTSRGGNNNSALNTYTQNNIYSKIYNKYIKYKNKYLEIKKYK